MDAAVRSWGHVIAKQILNTIVREKFTAGLLSEMGSRLLATERRLVDAQKSREDQDELDMAAREAESKAAEPGVVPERREPAAADGRGTNEEEHRTGSEAPLGATAGGGTRAPAAQGGPQPQVSQPAAAREANGAGAGAPAAAAVGHGHRRTVMASVPPGAPGVSSDTTKSRDFLEPSRGKALRFAMKNSMGDNPVDSILSQAKADLEEKTGFTLRGLTAKRLSDTTLLVNAGTEDSAKKLLKWWEERKHTKGKSNYIKNIRVFEFSHERRQGRQQLRILAQRVIPRDLLARVVTKVTGLIDQALSPGGGDSEENRYKVEGDIAKYVRKKEEEVSSKAKALFLGLAGDADDSQSQDGGSGTGAARQASAPGEADRGSGGRPSGARNTTTESVEDEGEEDNEGEDVEEAGGKMTADQRTRLAAAVKRSEAAVADAKTRKKLPVAMRGGKQPRREDHTPSPTPAELREEERKRVEAERRREEEEDKLREQERLRVHRKLEAQAKLEKQQSAIKAKQARAPVVPAAPDRPKPKPPVAPPSTPAKKRKPQVITPPPAARPKQSPPSQTGIKDHFPKATSPAGRLRRAGAGDKLLASQTQQDLDVEALGSDSDPPGSENTSDTDSSEDVYEEEEEETEEEGGARGAAGPPKAVKAALSGLP